MMIGRGLTLAMAAALVFVHAASAGDEPETSRRLLVAPTREPLKPGARCAEEVYPDGGMVSEASMPVGGDATDFIVEFRYMPDEETLKVTSIGISRPPEVPTDA